jgi:hypothetical protein
MKDAFVQCAKRGHVYSKSEGPNKYMKLNVTAHVRSDVHKKQASNPPRRK